ncbi:MAG: YfbM family protein [Planctomycetes bacterium]|nr:YfbM family protein [Planctomycetota bacterium]
MSMIGNFYLLDAAQMRSLLAEPATVHDVTDAAYEAGDGRFVDVDKAWHCLHFLLTGCDEGGNPPLNFILSGGTEVGTEDVGYGPARVFRPVDVMAIGEALAPLESEDLLRRFDARRMDKLGIYPDAGHWSTVDPKADLGYFLGAFDELKALVARAHDEGLGLLVWLS